MADGVVRVGISGWRYPPWRGVFYPEGLPQRSELGYASRRFGTIELSGSFYSLQRPESYARWYGETPPDFVFSVKGPRFVTHMLKLRDVDVALANFFASGIASLYESGYTKVALARWARRIRRWRDGVEPSDARRIAPSRRPSRRSRDVYCYFDNGSKVKAPRDAERLTELFDGTAATTAIQTAARPRRP